MGKIVPPPLSPEHLDRIDECEWLVIDRCRRGASKCGTSSTTSWCRWRRRPRWGSSTAATRTSSAGSTASRSPVATSRARRPTTACWVATATATSSGSVPRRRPLTRAPLPSIPASWTRSAAPRCASFRVMNRPLSYPSFKVRPCF